MVRRVIDDNGKRKLEKVNKGVISQNLDILCSSHLVLAIYFTCFVYASIKKNASLSLLIQTLVFARLYYRNDIPRFLCFIFMIHCLSLPHLGTGKGRDVHEGVSLHPYAVERTRSWRSQGPCLYDPSLGNHHECGEERRSEGGMEKNKKMTMKPSCVVDLRLNVCFVLSPSISVLTNIL